MARERFATPSGVRVPAVTAAEMRDVDRVAVEDVGVQLLQMMENAGRTLAVHVAAAAPERTVIAAGPGGNGGGGLACARHLANRDVRVTVVLDRPPEALTGGVAQQYRILDEMAVTVETGVDGVDGADSGAVFVYALVGYGLDGPLRGPARTLVDVMNGGEATVVSLDVPSGVDATTGETPGVAARPETTVTLALPKTGLGGRSGSLVLADIGVPRVVYDRLGIGYDDPFGERWWVELTDDR